MDVSRRGFLATGVTLLALSTTSSVDAMQQTDVSDEEFRAAPMLVGPADERPAPDSEFFSDKSQYAYLYRETETAELYVISDSDSVWGAADEWHFIDIEGDVWGDSNGDGLVEPGSYDGVDVGIADINEARITNYRNESGTFSIPGATQNTITVSFTNTYRHPSPAVGIDAGGDLVGGLTAEWRSWQTDADGNATGMDIVFRNEGTTDVTGRWNVAGITTS
jgi:hypothetical protein